MPEPAISGHDRGAYGYPPPGRGEPHWPPQVAILAVIVLQLLLPDRLLPGPKWLVPALEGVLLISLVLSAPQRLEAPHSVRRGLALVTTAVVTIANGISLVLMSHLLLHHQVSSGHELIISGTQIWLNNVIIFGLWYWEIDRGGPGHRAAGLDDAPDFLFPQMTDEVARLYPNWRPMFIDYLYLALTNATAMSPTDTMPLTTQVKSLMGAQSVISLVTIGLIVSRAVNIL